MATYFDKATGKTTTYKDISFWLAVKTIDGHVHQLEITTDKLFLASNVWKAQQFMKEHGLEPLFPSKYITPTVNFINFLYLTQNN